MAVARPTLVLLALLACPLGAVPLQAQGVLADDAASAAPAALPSRVLAV